MDEQRIHSSAPSSSFIPPNNAASYLHHHQQLLEPSEPSEPFSTSSSFSSSSHLLAIAAGPAPFPPPLPPQRHPLPHFTNSQIPSTTSSNLAHDQYIFARKRRLTSTDSPQRHPSHRPFQYHEPTPSAGLHPFAPHTSHVASSAMHRSPASPQDAPVPGSSISTAIDLTEDTPPRPQPTAYPSYNPPANQARTSPFTLPPWQPDCEAATCHVCGNHFSFWFRKHHCRRCGRVVCANCSPHRITLPRQYIVQPPQIIDFAAEHPFGPSESSWGGDEVRVCNPCVPDPNLSPPTFPTFSAQSPQSNQPNSPFTPPWPASHPNFGTTAPTPTGPPGVWVGRSGRAYDWVRPFPGHRQSLSTTTLPISQPYAHQTSGYRLPNSTNSGPGPSGPQVIRSPAGYMPHPHGLSHPAIAQDLASFLHSHQPQPSAFGALPVPQRRQIAEADECPVCGEELPPTGPDGNTTDRETHVESCIKSHMYSASAPQTSTAQLASTPSGRPDGQQSPSSSITTADASSSRPRRMTGGRMLVYTATEKDCAGEDGLAHECVICLEDFEVGNDMARLECLCKFHRKCIRDWWETKGAGSCPTHQLHD